jgi:UDP-GlcNAc:undecaprenyl-phosphate GlcNAc-1-phosphate transferase
MFAADKDHVHHRLLALGFSHRSAVLTLYAMSAGLSILAMLAVVSRYRNAGAILLMAMVGMYLGIRRLGYEQVALIRTGTLLRWCERVIFRRLSSLAVLDLVLVASAFWIAFILKYDGLSTAVEARWYLQVFPFVLVIHMAAFFSLGVYRGVWRAMGSADLLPLTVAVSSAVMFSYILSAIYDPPPGVQAFYSIHGLVVLILVLGARSAHKILVERRRRHHATEREQVLIYGAGRRGEWIMRELSENRGLGLHPIGFVDDDPYLIGRSINRVRVLGSGRDVAALLDSQKVSALIISSPKIDTERISSLISFCHRQHIPVLRAHFTLDCLSEANGPVEAHAPDLSRLTPAVPYT